MVSQKDTLGMTQQNTRTYDAQQADMANPTEGTGTLYHLGYVSTETGPFRTGILGFDALILEDEGSFH